MLEPLSSAADGDVNGGVNGDDDAETDAEADSETGATVDAEVDVEADGEVDVDDVADGASESLDFGEMSGESSLDFVGEAFAGFSWGSAERFVFGRTTTALLASVDWGSNGKRPSNPLGK
jgi:hypothetical protein